MKTKNLFINRILSIFLCVAMIMAYVPSFSLTAFAADGDACTVADCVGTYTNGFCSADDTHYEQPTTNSNGVYQIENAGQLYWFADKVNNDNENYGSANAVLTANIDLNPGYTFTFNSDTGLIHDTGLIEVKNNDTVVAYLGTGIKGNTSGTNTVFDETASVAGAIYTDANDATADTVDLPGIHAWTPIGWYDSVNYDYFEYRGTFDGQEYTVSGIYINGTEL